MGWGGGGGGGGGGGSRVVLHPVWQRGDRRFRFSYSGDILLQMALPSAASASAVAPV